MLIVSAIALFILLIAGIALGVVNIFFIPKAVFLPVMVTSLAVSGISFVLLVAIASVVSSCEEEISEKNFFIAEGKTHRNAQPSYLPGNFLSPKLRGICWANVMLQCLRALDDDMKQQLYNFNGDTPHLRAIQTIGNLVQKLDANQHVSKKEMEELMNVINNNSFNGVSNAGRIYQDPVSFLDKIFEIICPRDDEPHGTLYTGHLLGIHPAHRNHDYSENAEPKNLTEAFSMEAASSSAVLQLLSFNLPKSLMVYNANPQVGLLKRLRPDDAEGHYFLRIPKLESEASVYKYRLKGILSYHKSGRHYTFSIADQKNSHIVYNDARAIKQNGPLLLKDNSYLALFEMVEEEGEGKD